MATEHTPHQTDALAPEPTGTTTPPVPGRWLALTTALWTGHGILRIFVFVQLLVYGWSKLLLSQMGVLGYGYALYAFGEKSPMGLLWNFIAYAPALQFLCGLFEVLAGALLIWRRTTWLGGLLGTGAMGVVFLLNLLYDVPVKQLALVLTIACVLIALPDLPRLFRFLAGGPVGKAFTPCPIPWPRVHSVTRWIIGSLGVMITLAPALLAPNLLPRETDSPLPGVYRVVEDTTAPADRLAKDQRWQTVAFDQYAYGQGGKSMITIRHANGDLREGLYEHGDEGEVRLALYPVMEGDRPLIRDTGEPITLTWSIDDDGFLHLRGKDQELVLASDPELSYL